MTFPAYAQGLRRAGDLIGTAIFAVVFVAINLQVFMRYLVGDPVRWSEELPIVAFSLAVLWAGSVMLRAADHIVFDSVFVLLPDKAGRVLYGIASLILAAIFVAVLPGVADFAAYMKVLSTPILRVRYDLIFFVFAFFVLATAVWHVAWAVGAFRKPLPKGDPGLL